MANLKMQPSDYSATDTDEADPIPADLVTFGVSTEFAGLRLDQALARLLPDYSRSRLQAWIRDGLVEVDGKAASVTTKLRGLEEITVAIQPDTEALAFTAEAMTLNIVFEDAAILVLDKPPGLVVHPANGNWSGTLLNGLLHHCPQLTGVPRAGIVHRLDKDTSGLMVVAKTLVAQTDLVRQLQARTVTREYLAVIEGELTHGGIVNAPIGRHPRERTRMAVMSGGKPAATHYRVLENLPWHTLVLCTLETGRTHQIRVHMQSLGFPLAGDPVYGGRPRAMPEPIHRALALFGRQALHARHLALRHPVTGDTRAWDAALPDDMKMLLEALR